jgi:flap endonuclease-1
MGVNITDIIPKKEITIKDLKGKVIAIDAYNTLYQFLTSIRQPDGTPLQDRKGNVTSHLSGLFYRNISLLQDGIKPVYVFDGKPPELKTKEIEKRREAKREAQAKYENAKKINDTDSMRKYSSQFVKVTDEIVAESKALLGALGIPVVQAPSEGEAEAAHLAKKHQVWASASQDYDSLLCATPILIRNLTLARRRKSSSGIYIDVNPELIELEHVLNKLNIGLDQLICLAIIVGTDFNPGGIKGLGQKRALEIAQRYNSPVEIFNSIEKNDRYEMDFDWHEIFAHFSNYESEAINIEFQEVNPKKIKQILLNHDFSEDRIDSGLAKLQKIEEEKKQKGLGEFF